MKLAIYQGSGTVLNVQKNLALLAQMAVAAAAQGADLLILPELFLTGYNIGEAVRQLAEPSAGPSLQQAAQIARQHQIALLFGYPEISGGQFYNSAALIDAEGQLVANYRKTHLFGSEERRLFTPGNQSVVHAIADLQIGILICFDVEFPEAVRALALAGAELIVVPTANMLPYTLIPTMVVPTRALENQIFIAYVNRVGTEGDLTYCGLSCVVGPDGKDRVRAAFAEELLITEVNREAIAQERAPYCYLHERRSELYQQ